MMEVIAAHQAEVKRKQEEEAQKKKKKGGAGFHAFASFDAKASQAAAHGKRAREEVAGDSDSEPEPEEDGVREGARPRGPPVEWGSPPLALQLRSEALAGGMSTSQFVAHFIRFVMGMWARSFTDSSLKPAGTDKLSDTQRALYETEAPLRETEDMLAPLIQQLEKDAVDTEIMVQLEKLVSLAAEREYKEAMSAYVEITVGKKKWNNAVMFGEAKHNKGFNSRRVKRDEDNKFDTDETVKKYVQGLRRVMNYAQLIRPSQDVSKHM
mmetsp:Transcript_106521/g.301298  ORF Transcript_106521/g.301298 Transcript_106521/m.301298 type:complete len:267 (-) Transcript_106521:370-1170(-)